jgi:hypothetical protein
MKRMAVLWAVFLLGMGAWAERVADRLHGFALDLPEGWKVVLGREVFSSPTWKAPFWCGASPEAP